MYELVQISEKRYYINCPAKIGVRLGIRDHVYLIDSGNDKEAGRKIRQILDKNGWHLAGWAEMNFSLDFSRHRDFDLYDVILDPVNNCFIDPFFVRKAVRFQSMRVCII